MSNEQQKKEMSTLMQQMVKAVNLLVEGCSMLTQEEQEEVLMFNRHACARFLAPKERTEQQERSNAAMVLGCEMQTRLIYKIREMNDVLSEMMEMQKAVISLKLNIKDEPTGE